MDKKRILGICLTIIGITLLINSQVSILGAIIGVSAIASTLSLILGLTLMLVGIILFASARLKHRESPLETLANKEEYYHERAIELTSDSRPVWIHQGELYGLKKEFEKIGINIRGPEGHYGGKTGPYQRHINLTGRNKKGVKLTHKHVYIAQDPNDPRIQETSYGFKTKKYSPDYKRDNN